VIGERKKYFRSSGRKRSELAEEIKSEMFVFEDILTLGDREVQLILRQVDMKD
jgi:flagellar motor switch protein FliG